MNDKTVQMKGRTVRDDLEQIRTENQSKSGKGIGFEELICKVAPTIPEWEIAEIWRWSKWTEREELTPLPANDCGIDAVAKRNDGRFIAIQAKFYEDGHRVDRDNIKDFIAATQSKIWSMRWIVVTSQLTGNAYVLTQDSEPPIRVIDFNEHLDREIETNKRNGKFRTPLPLQQTAIDDVVNGFENHNRGRLIMACGTGKTYTALEIAKREVADSGAILFAAPSIALISQARREWLRHASPNRSLKCTVVCSDNTAGGRGEKNIGVNEIECPVTNVPSIIAKEMQSNQNETAVIFCTYQSLDKVIRAQRDWGAPVFDLTIADEAHRTTGRIIGDNEQNAEANLFQAIHDDEKIRSRKRLYMTATPRVYTSTSRKIVEGKGYEVIDMNDLSIYGPEFHRLTFRKAVDKEMLSDYRVIVLAVNESAVTRGLRRQLDSIERSRENKETIGTPSDITRVLGVSLAINGAVKGQHNERPDRLVKTITFANTIERSKWFSKALINPEVKRVTTKHLEGKKKSIGNVKSEHLDGTHTALKRNESLRHLGAEARENELRIVSNAKLFSEGIDVPSLDAVAFLDPRKSPVDIIQSVGRVMRKAEGKKFGYIVVPVFVPEGENLEKTIEQKSEGYETIGKVLSALKAHDDELIDLLETNVWITEAERPDNPPPDPNLSEEQELELMLKQVDSNAIYARVAAVSGLADPGKITANEIEYSVNRAGNILREEQAACGVAKALELSDEPDSKKNVCIIASLMLFNAFLLQRRLRTETRMDSITPLNKIASSQDPLTSALHAWENIMQRDYAPVFKPAVHIAEALPHTNNIRKAIIELAEKADHIADKLSAMGYDHAGPLYHRILPSAKSDGAFYTNNLPAIMLARLALNEDFVDWSDFDAVSKLKIIDPACGTGTLLMAALRTIKDRVQSKNEFSESAKSNQPDQSAKCGQIDMKVLHRQMVENVLCGLDINQHAVQLAACNLTLGAPTVDYKHMNLFTMPHGLQSNGSVKAGSLEILHAAENVSDLASLISSLRKLKSLDAEQVDKADEITFPLKDLDVVIMNPPYTANQNRGNKYTEDVRRQMQEHELEIRDNLKNRDHEAGSVINTNSIQTFFTPIADQVMRIRKGGTLAMVVPATVCIGEAAFEQRCFLAERFHIERIVISHVKDGYFADPAGNVLLVCRRWNAGQKPDTKITSLLRMPTDFGEARKAADAIAKGEDNKWAKTSIWSEARIRAGDWSAVQWTDQILAEAVIQIESNASLTKIGNLYNVEPGGQRIADAFKHFEKEVEGGIRGFHSVGNELRNTMFGEPEAWYLPKAGKENMANSYKKMRSRLLVAKAFGTHSSRLTALWSNEIAFGSGWIPVGIDDEVLEKALCAWWNSTPVLLMLLNRRSKMLNFPNWSLAHLREIRIPKANSAAIGALHEAFEKHKNTPLLQMWQGNKCKVRKALDEAAALACDVNPQIIADWRDRLSKEPTIRGTKGF